MTVVVEEHGHYRLVVNGTNCIQQIWTWSIHYSTTNHFAQLGRYQINDFDISMVISEVTSVDYQWMHILRADETSYLNIKLETNCTQIPLRHSPMLHVQQQQRYGTGQTLTPQLTVMIELWCVYCEYFAENILETRCIYMMHHFFYTEDRTLHHSEDWYARARWKQRTGVEIW